MKKIIVMLLALVALCGCQKEEFEGFDMPFVKVTTTTGASQTVVLSNVNNINTYVVSVSSKMLTTALVVNYEIVVGDGLQEGVDYELVTTGNQPSPSVSPATARTSIWVCPAPMVSRNNL